MGTLTPRILALAAAAAVLAPAAARAQACTNGGAAFGLSASSYMDSQLNPPPGEDAEFFSSTGGVPTIYFLLDNSGSMKRLPPNGSGFAALPLPPVNDVNCPGSGDSYDPGCANKVSGSGGKPAPPRNIGCGLDNVSKPYSVAGTYMGEILSRSFAPSCGKTLTAGKYLSAYDSSLDYAHEASVCPYYANPNPLTGADGYDPKFYCKSDGTTTSCSGHANFFDKNMVFHEAHTDPGTYSGWGFNGTDGSTFNPTTAPGDGWSDSAVYPYKKSNSAYGSVDDFCAQYSTDVGKAGFTTQDSTSAAEICKTCLNTRGFFFDGYAYRANMESLNNVLYPSIWYTGNYLNFFPPKFLVARKALKDLLMNNLRIRSGIAVFGSGGTSPKDGARQIQALNPACNNTFDSTSNLYSNRSSFMTAIDGVAFNQGTPLGEALLNVIQQFRSPNTSWFDGSSTNSTFEPPTGTGSANQQGICFPCQNTSVVVITDGRPKPGDDTNFPTGTATTAQSDGTCSGTVTTGCIGNTSTGIGDSGSGASVTFGGPDKNACPLCQGTTAVGGPGGTSPFGPTALDLNGKSKEYMNNAIRVAWMAHHFDFRKDGETPYACNDFTGKQSLNIYALGFGAGAFSDAGALLGAMANPDVGGGSYIEASNAGELNAAFSSILLQIDARATSFSVASVNALQATAGQSVIIPRFNPSKTAFWNGHLYRFELYSEFAASGSSACTPGGTGDLDCDCACTSVFLQDAEGSFISEDATGTFKKNTPNKPTCGPTNKCPTGSCGKPDPDPTRLAVSHWDAADRLAAQSWKTRVAYTVIDDPTSRNGILDSSDPMVQLINPTTKAFDTTTISRLIPYMGLTLDAGGNCDVLGNSMTKDAVGAGAVSRSLTACAEAYLAFVLGADLFNANDYKTTTSPCPYPPPSPGKDASGNPIWNPLALCDRKSPGKLGDIFHSSPVRVLEPGPSSSLFSAYNNQTLSSLWSTPTAEAVLPSSTNSHAYDDYAAAYSTRRRLVVVGANDGFLHAFDAGNWQADKDDPSLTGQGIHTSQAPFNGYYDKGTGDELWAFLPPDLLAKIPLMVGNGQHQYFVDGDPMVRDVWVDGGTANAKAGGTASLDDIKTPSEFHTVVVGAERRGGTHYFALDITDATKTYSESVASGTSAAPRFLWIYPQATDPKQLDMGETYTGFLPVGPPIGPVRLDANTTAPAPSGNTRKYLNIPVHERWVVFLPGGFDPQYVRGHGVHMLDVWTGKELLDFSRPAVGDSTVASNNPRWKLDAPVASTIGMVAFGPTSRGDDAFPPNGAFFDTATFGDANGALWTVRFNTPGQVGADGKVTNWFGGRSFQLSKSSNTGLCAGRQPFFYVTANVPLYASNRMYRVLLGTGDRFNILDQYGGTCGPDNIRACVLRGCTVSVPQATNSIAVDDLLGTQSMGFTSTNLCGGSGETWAEGTAGTQCKTIAGRVQVDITNCSGFDSNASGTIGTSKSFSVDCSLQNGGAACKRTATAIQYAGDQLVKSTALDYKNWFFSVRNFDDTGARYPFTTLAAAAAYDAARLTETDLAQIDGSSASPTPASADGAGWALYYNHSGTYTDPVTSTTHAIASVDERTASPSTTPGDGCIYWNTVQPALKPKSAQCPCTYQNTDRVMYYYGANIGTGDLCLKTGTKSGTGTNCTVSTTTTRSTQGTTLTTPPAPQPTYFINSKGQVSVGMVSIQVGSGAENVSTGMIDDAIRQVDWLPVSPGMEACRHAGGTAPNSEKCQER